MGKESFKRELMDLHIHDFVHMGIGQNSETRQDAYGLFIAQLLALSIRQELPFVTSIKLIFRSLLLTTRTTFGQYPRSLPRSRKASKAS